MSRVCGRVIPPLERYEGVGGLRRPGPSVHVIANPVVFSVSDVGFHICSMFFSWKPEVV